MITELFTKEYIDSMRPHILKTFDNLVDDMVKNHKGHVVDIVEKLALPLPSYVRILNFNFTDIF